MTDNNKYHTVGAVVDQFLIDNGLTEHFFQKALSWALWGLTDLKLFIHQDVKTCLLPVSSRKTAVLPINCVDVTKIAVKRGQYIITLAVDDTLSKTKRTDDDDVVSGWLSGNMPNGINVNNYSGYYFFNYNGNSLYSIGRGLPLHKGYQIIQEGGSKILLLDYNFPCDEVYVEYITDGFDPCGETVLNPVLRDYVLKYIDHRYECKNNPKATETSIRRMAQDLYHAEMKVRASVNSIDKATLISSSRAGVKLTPKI
jgi:hypothetical protein